MISMDKYLLSNSGKVINTEDMELTMFDTAYINSVHFEVRIGYKSY